MYVVGVEEGIFPGERVRYNDEEVEEERRLCYVAMTRAKERLTMTCTRQRMLFGRTSVSEPSRFLEEVPSENADWVGRQAQGASGFGDTSFDEGSSYSTRGYGSYGQGAARYDSVMQRRPKSQASQNSRRRSPPPPRRCFSFPPATRSTTRRSVTDWSSPSPLWAAMRMLEVAFDTDWHQKVEC